MRLAKQLHDDLQCCGRISQVRLGLGEVRLGLCKVKV
jgi:hypothetical protein